MQQISIIERNDSPVAFEFHNQQTGHCYVDYIERAGMTEKEGYTKTPLFKFINGSIVLREEPNVREIIRLMEESVKKECPSLSNNLPQQDDPLKSLVEKIYSKNQ
jgi:hypothetical protein